MTDYTNLTQHEIQALQQVYNLADAHTHQSQTPSQQEIISRLPQLWYEAETAKQCEMEQQFIEAFWAVQRQSYALKTPTLLIYAASIGLAIVGNYLKKKNMSLSLIHPCFDNLHDMFKQLQVPMQPLEESWLHDFDSIYTTLAKNVTADAILIVDPNNPTGFTLSSNSNNPTQGFEEIVRFAKDYKKLLILDLSFASFLLPDNDLVIIELYELLETSGVSYISVEDTGKTWPLQDAKVALIKCSKDLYKDIWTLHTTYLLNVSPFVLNLVTQYLLDSAKDNLASISNLLERNRALAIKAFDNSLLLHQQSKSKTSVAWFKIADSRITATDLQKSMQAQGVYVLPGNYFYWNDITSGEQYIRIALARDTNIFESALERMRKAV